MNLDKPLQSNPSGYNLLCLSENEWAFEVVDAGIYYGTFYEVVKFTLLSYSFDINQINEAVDELLRNKEHNSAHFGMWGSFMFTFELTDNTKRRAS